MDNLTDLNNLLNQPNTFERNLVQIIQVAQTFAQLYDNKDSVVGDAESIDDMRPILATIGDPSARIPVDIDVIIATILKVLLRKGVNRLALGKYGMTAIIKSVHRIQAAKNIPAAAEMCNVILNTCYDGVNVQLLIELDGVSPLLRFLNSKEIPVLCSSLGALQGLCYVPRGRNSLRQMPKVCTLCMFYLFQAIYNCFLSLQALARITTFLGHEDPAVRARAVGVIHNLSVDAVSIAPILETHCVSQLVALMRDPCAEVCRAAAGTVQNLSRDVEARAAVVQAGALEYLSDLLFASDVACQVWLCAAATLWSLNFLQATVRQ